MRHHLKGTTFKGLGKEGREKADHYGDDDDECGYYFGCFGDFS